MKAGSPDPGCGPVNGPNACEKTKGAFHEPQDALLGNEQVTHFEVHGPNAFEKRKGAFHEPQDALLRNEQVTHFEVHGPNAFEKRKEAFHEPERRPPARPVLGAYYPRRR